MRRLATVAAAVWQDTTVWTQAPLSGIEPAAESLFHLRVPDVEKPSFLAIASPPSDAASKGAFDFLVKSVAGSTAELLCGLKRGDVVELSQAVGRGFDIEQIEPAEKYPTVLIFATGSGISPIRSLIESGFNADKRSDVRLYYGARNLKRMAYQDRFKDWESSGVKIVPVLSQPDDNWTGESNYVRAAFSRAKQIYSPTGTGVVLCGQKQMTEEITSILVSDGVSSVLIICQANEPRFCFLPMGVILMLQLNWIPEACEHQGLDSLSNYVLEHRQTLPAIHPVLDGKPFQAYTLYSLHSPYGCVPR
ncbi:hypothetical protein Peur_042504 [Populus x canadensis]